MKNTLKCLLLISAAYLPVAHATILPDARASSYVEIYDGGTGQASYFHSDTFGTHDFLGGDFRTTIGSNDSHAPFVQLHGGTTNVSASRPQASASLHYTWEVVGASDVPVLVHISTSGWLKSEYDYVPFGISGQVGASGSPNRVATEAIVSFRTGTIDEFGYGGYDRRYRGLSASASGYQGVTPVAATVIGDHQTVNAQFNESFDMWVRPNYINDIFLIASGGFRNEYNLSSMGKESFSFDAFVDPIITIDAQFAGSYSLVQSVIPSVTAVPEPETYAMLLAGLGLMGAVARRRKQKSMAA